MRSCNQKGCDSVITDVGHGCGLQVSPWGRLQKVTGSRGMDATQLNQKGAAFGVCGDDSSCSVISRLRHLESRGLICERWKHPDVLKMRMVPFGVESF
jgi:hypothetical protein